MFSGVDDGNLPFILVSVFFLQKPDHESYAILIRLIADNFGPISKRQMKVPETDSKKLPANGVRFPFSRKKAHGRHSVSVRLDSVMEEAEGVSDWA